MMAAMIWNDDEDGWMARGHFVGTIDEIALTIGRRRVARFGEHCQLAAHPRSRFRDSPFEQYCRTGDQESTVRVSTFETGNGHNFFNNLSVETETLTLVAS